MDQCKATTTVGGKYRRCERPANHPMCLIGRHVTTYRRKEVRFVGGMDPQEGARMVKDIYTRPIAAGLARRIRAMAGHIRNPYTLAEIVAMVESREFSAEMLLQHLLARVADCEAQPAAVPVYVEWRNPDDDWHWFTLLGFAGEWIRLHGRSNDDGDTYTGGPLWAHVSEIESMQEVER